MRSGLNGVGVVMTSKISDDAYEHLVGLDYTIFLGESPPESRVCARSVDFKGGSGSLKVGSFEFFSGSDVASCIAQSTAGRVVLISAKVTPKVQAVLDEILEPRKYCVVKPPNGDGAIRFIWKTFNDMKVERAPEWACVRPWCAAAPKVAPTPSKAPKAPAKAPKAKSKAKAKPAHPSDMIGAPLGPPPKLSPAKKESK